MASYAENVSIWWRHHANDACGAVDHSMYGMSKKKTHFRSFCAMHFQRKAEIWPESNSRSIWYVSKKTTCHSISRYYIVVFVNSRKVWLLRRKRNYLHPPVYNIMNNIHIACKNKLEFMIGSQWHKSNDIFYISLFGTFDIFKYTKSCSHMYMLLTLSPRRARLINYWQTRFISYMSIPWLLAPCIAKPRKQPCKTGISFVPMRKNFKYQCHFSMDEW